MIKITKPTLAPQILRTRGARKKAKHCRDFAANTTDYQSGKLTFLFDGGIYGHAEVKDALVLAQHSKCCFCESKIGRDGDVEHFRPKAGCCQNAGQTLLRPGYYWLAYEWNNLFLACSACNQRHKRNLFPLINPGQRAMQDTDDVSVEKPLFINPGEDNPEELISFRQEIPYAIRGNRRGKRTIDALGLNREIMNERRRDLLKALKIMQKIVDLEDERPQTPEWTRVVADAKQFIADSTRDDAEFANMVRALRRGH